MLVLEAIDVVKTYGQGSVEVQALRGVSVGVAAGDFLSIMGPSGCGKSTLLHLLGGIESPNSGSVLLGKEDFGSLSDKERSIVRRRKIGFVFQKMNLMPTLTALENVALPLRIDGVSRADSQARAQTALKRAEIAHRAKHFPHEMSGGEQQRVAIARALVIEPAVLLADEPTGALDSANGKQIVELLLACAAQGQTVIVVTHDPGVASRSSCLLRMRDGQIVDRIDNREQIAALAKSVVTGV
jgi:putative ABC transport system ATP-binding protein